MLPVFAKHITGGEIIYDYLGPGSTPNLKNYRITLRLFRDNNTNGGAALPTTLVVSVFNNDNNDNVSDYLNVNRASEEVLAIISSPNCITSPPSLNYSAGYYIFEITLPANAKGYTATYQTCCRIDGIANTANMVGATYVGEIPGTNTLAVGNDNSARFTTGISIICYNKPFRLDFSATDPDLTDSLVYSLTNAYNGGAATSAGFAQPAPPAYASIPYNNPYNGTNPFGATATINTATGIISGIAPNAGKYVVCVLVKSYRNGVFIADHRKDFIVTVADCDFASSVLDPVYTNCDDLTTVFHNNNTSLLNLTFDWDFGDPASGANNNSALEIAPHTFSAAGDYIIKLTVNRGTSCADSATALVRVWPGFYPKFDSVPPHCVNVPVVFHDATTANYGVINFWRWNFGEGTVNNDTSRLQNPTYIYPTTGTKNVELVVETSKGCRDTIYRDILIVDKPDLKVTNDTLICTIDTLRLNALTNFAGGTITWSPNYMISDIHSFNPLVSPDVPTRYTAFFDDGFGCTTSASVFVNVVTNTILTAPNDTTICRTDSVVLKIPFTNALYFNWTSNPAAGISNSLIKNPTVLANAAFTIFNVRASISNKCFINGSVTIKTVPYPTPAITGQDTICFGKNVQLFATGGSIYIWTPASYLTNSNIANPIVQAPKTSITYQVSVKDTLGCPKPVTAFIKVNVVKIIADAGPQDTAIVLDQPLQLTGTGGNIFLWTPNTWLTNSFIYNPISNPLNTITYKLTVSNSIGCFGEDTIKVKVFFVPPDVYVPSAFTPGTDKLNDVFRPIALGIKSLENFSVFNRWGELLYSTKTITQGWDGTYKGNPQNAGTYVWEVRCTDYKNKTIRRKGSVILIR